MLCTAGNSDLAFLQRGKLDDITNEITPCSRTRGQQDCVLLPLLYFIDKKGFCIRRNLSIGIEILRFKRYKLIENPVIQYQAHSPAVGESLKSNKALGSEIGFYIMNRSSQ